MPKVSNIELIKIGKQPVLSVRTITNWMRELEENDLILREQKKLNHVSYTYLKPY